MDGCVRSKSVRSSRGLSTGEPAQCAPASMFCPPNVMVALCVCVGGVLLRDKGRREGEGGWMNPDAPAAFSPGDKLHFSHDMSTCNHI